MDDAQTFNVLSSLSHRLQRLEYYLSGVTPTSEAKPQAQPTSPDQTIRARLVRLEHDLASLTSRSAPVRELLSLRKQFLSVRCYQESYTIASKELNMCFPT